MTERSESERAELVALADRLAAFQRILESARRRDDQTIRVWSDDLASVSGAVTALRRLAAQDQKPVAWRILCTDKSRGSTGHYYTEQLPFEPGENLRQRSEPVPLHLSPPPAAGWDARKALEAIEPYLDAIVCYASSINEHHGNQVAKMVREALRHNAPPDSGAGESDDSWDEATGYAERLAVALWGKHYKTEASQWKPLSGDLIGILTQIDNMTTGLARVPDHASAELSKFANDLAAKQEPLGVQISAEDLEGMYIRSEPSANASTELQNDLGDMLRALGMSDAAQPKSPHEVFQSAIAEMKRQRANASAEARMREALEKTNQLLIDVMHDQEADIRDRASKQFDKNIDALSKPAPVAASASAEARLREAFLAWIDKRISDTATQQRQAYSANLDVIGSRHHAAQCELLAVKSKFEALTAHPHASAEARLREVPYNIKAIATIISLSYGEDPEADAELSRMCTADNKPVQCWEVYEEQAKALFVWFNAVLDSLSAHPHASDCDKTTYDVLGDQRTCVGVPASGIAKMMDAVENPKQPNEALKKLMRGHASDCDKQGDR